MPGKALPLGHDMADAGEGEMRGEYPLMRGGQPSQSGATTVLRSLGVAVVTDRPLRLSQRDDGAVGGIADVDQVCRARGNLIAAMARRMAGNGNRLDARHHLRAGRER